MIDTKEQTILSFLYQEGSSSVSAIARGTLINRTTLYPVLEKLLKKGLVTKLQVEGHVVFAAIPLKELQAWGERKKKEAEKETKQFLDWAQKQQEETTPSLHSEIKYFDGKEGVMSLYHDTWRNNKEKVIYAITDYEKAYQTMGDEFLREDYFLQRVQKGVRVKSLLPDSKVGRADVASAKELLRDMRFIDLFEDLGIEINVYDDKLALFAFDEKKPSGVLIKNNTIAEAFKHIFAFLWKKGKVPKKK